MLLGSRIGVVFGLAFGLLSGCYSEPDIDKIVCRGPAYECPDGYVCRVAADGGDGRGRCCKPGDPLCGSRAVDASPSDLSSEAAQPLDGSMKTDEMIDLCSKATIAISKVNTIEEVLEDPYVKASLLSATDPVTKTQIWMAPPPFMTSFLKEAGRQMTFPPRFGEHNSEIYGALGYSEEQIGGLKAKEVI